MTLCAVPVLDSRPRVLVGYLDGEGRICCLLDVFPESGESPLDTFRRVLEATPTDSPTPHFITARGDWALAER